MGIELKQTLRLSQQLVMTPQLQQAIKLLQLNRLELSEVVNQELVENPMLEENTDSIDSSSDSRITDPSSEQQRDEDSQIKALTNEEKLVAGKDDFNWEAYIEDFNSSSSSPSPSMKDINSDLPSFESILTKTSTLEDHLTWQLSMAVLSDDEKDFGELVIGNLSQDGYLKANLEDLAKESGLDPEDAEEVLKIIHNFDPVGAASRTLGECLLAQARFIEPPQPMVIKIIEEHLHNLEKKNYPAIAKALKTPINDVIHAVKLILELEPKPGRAFQTSETRYITPDIYVYKVGNEYAIVLNEEGLPRLRVSPYYKNILSAAKKDSNKNTKEYVQEKLRSAIWLIRSIANRQKTIYKVTEAILERQHDFFEKGVQFLKPMVLRDVANDIGMHESTISRVTTNKYVHTPVGIFELKYFFNSKIGTTNGSESFASEAVKEKLRQLVSGENPKRPLSDQKLVELLKKDNIDIARRTIAKYRDVLNILPSSKRKKVF